MQQTNSNNLFQDNVWALLRSITGPVNYFGTPNSNANGSYSPMVQSPSPIRPQQQLELHLQKILGQIEAQSAVPPKKRKQDDNPLPPNKRIKYNVKVESPPLPKDQIHNGNVIIIPDFGFLRRCATELFTFQCKTARQQGYKYKLFIPSVVYEDLERRRDIDHSVSCGDALQALSLYKHQCTSSSGELDLTLFKIWTHCPKPKEDDNPFIATIKEIAYKFDQGFILVLTLDVKHVSEYFGDPRILVRDRVPVNMALFDQ